MKSEAGKGDSNRIRGKKARKQYEINYVRIFGQKCPNCNGTGYVVVPGSYTDALITCDICNGKGRIYYEHK